MDRSGRRDGKLKRWWTEAECDEREKNSRNGGGWRVYE